MSVCSAIDFDCRLIHQVDDALGQHEYLIQLYDDCRTQFGSLLNDDMLIPLHRLSHIKDAIVTLDGGQDVQIALLSAVITYMIRTRLGECPEDREDKRARIADDLNDILMLIQMFAKNTKNAWQVPDKEWLALSVVAYVIVMRAIGVPALTQSLFIDVSFDPWVQSLTMDDSALFITEWFVGKDKSFTGSTTLLSAGDAGYVIESCMKQILYKLRLLHMNFGGPLSDEEQGMHVRGFLTSFVVAVAMALKDKKSIMDYGKPQCTEVTKVEDIGEDVDIDHFKQTFRVQACWSYIFKFSGVFSFNQYVQWCSVIADIKAAGIPLRVIADQLRVRVTTEEQVDPGFVQYLSLLPPGTLQPI